VALFNGAPALAMFLTGLALGRAGLFPPSNSTLAALVPVIGYCLAGGAAVSGVAALGLFLPPGSATQAAAFAALSFAAPVLSFGMAGTMLSIASRRASTAPIRWLATAGGCSLSGYILHSVLLGAIFYGWGMGLYGSLDQATVLAVAIGVTVVVCGALNLWRSRFRYGPDEWLLRSIVDLQWKPLKV
jgi:uncharacterized protein